MPSVLHMALVQLFRNRPELAPELIGRALHVEVPDFVEARIEDASFDDLDPAEYRADLVVLLSAGKPVLAIVLEVQLGRDPRKQYSWPMYAVGLRARFECPTCVLVVTVAEDVAVWARSTIELGPGNAWRPLVIGPASVPIVRTIEEARQDPELAVLSVMAHGKGELDTACATMTAAVGAVHELPDDRGVLYFDLIANSLGAAARRAFEELMDLENYEFQSEYMRRKEAEAIAKEIARGIEKGVAEGIAKAIAAEKAEGMAVGKAEGMAVGKAEGMAVGKAEDILLVLRARAIPVTPAQEARIRAIRELDVLDRCIVRAATVDAADSLFA